MIVCQSSLDVTWLTSHTAFAIVCEFSELLHNSSCSEYVDVKVCCC